MLVIWFQQPQSLCYDKTQWKQSEEEGGSTGYIREKQDEDRREEEGEEE